jgi:hypothetical protein
MLYKNYNRKGSVEKEMLLMSLKGLGAKRNWLAVNRQSYILNQLKAMYAMV